MFILRLLANNSCCLGIDCIVCNILIKLDQQCTVYWLLVYKCSIWFTKNSPMALKMVH